MESKEVDSIIDGIMGAGVRKSITPKPDGLVVRVPDGEVVLSEIEILGPSKIVTRQGGGGAPVVNIETSAAIVSPDGNEKITHGSKYANDMVRLKCMPDMLALGLFPNFKEVTESFACYEAAAQMVDPKDPNVDVHVIGDGSTPRTAATCAFRSAWNCFSYDPNLHSRWKVLGEHHGKVKRLWVCGGRVEKVADLFLEQDLPSGTGILIFPHSHARMGGWVDDVRARYKRLVVISMPCCVPHDKCMGRDPNLDYQNRHITSPKRRIKAWDFVGSGGCQ